MSSTLVLTLLYWLMFGLGYFCARLHAAYAKVHAYRELIRVLNKLTEDLNNGVYTATPGLMVVKEDDLTVVVEDNNQLRMFN